MFDNLLKKLSLIVATMGFANFVFGDTDYSSKCCEPAPCEKICEPPAKPYDQGYAICEDQMIGGYNASARIDVRCAWDFFVNASMLYMQIKEFGLDVGKVEPNSHANAGKIVQGRISHLDFDYKFGFKVGLGMSFNHDNWYSMVEYTRIHAEYSKVTTAGSGEYIVPGWTSLTLTNDPRVVQTKSEWKPSIDIIDLSLGRAYYVGTMLTFKPYGSIRWGWIDQKYEQKLAVLLPGNPSTVKPKMYAKSDSWMIGPRMGLDINWLFHGGFRLFSNTAVALLYQHYEADYYLQNISNPTAPYYSADKNCDHSFVTPNLQLIMGLGWGTYFSNNSWHVELLAGYSFEIFFNQNLMNTLRLFPNAPSDAGSLVLHGLVVTAGLDF